MKVLIVEDSHRLRSSIARGLRAEGFVVDLAADGEEALVLSATSSYDTIVLDLTLPKLDGIEVLRRLRDRRDSPPVLILSARDRTEDRIRGLELGADDYLVKPFDFGELTARVRALVRRKYFRRSPVIDLEGLVVDMGAREARFGSTPVELTHSEYSILECLAVRRGEVVTKDWLLGQLGDIKSMTTSNVVEVFVSSLRRKLRPFELEGLIQTRRGHGYIIS